VGPNTHLVHISTAFAEGRRGFGESHDIADYRNTYEWSKACAERVIADLFGSVTIIRPPLIIGRRCDGQVARFTGFYMLLRAAMTGLAPLLIGEPEGYMELVPVDDLAGEIVKACLGGRPQDTRVVVLGRGSMAMSVATTMDIARATINSWRNRHGRDSLDAPAVMPLDRWERFLLPLARTHLSARQLSVIDALSFFVPYLSITTPLRPTVLIDDVTDPLRGAVRFWAERNRAIVLRQPVPWALKRPT